MLLFPLGFSLPPCILGCPLRASSDVTRADLGLQLLSPRRDSAKLKWRHRVHGLSADRLEKVLYGQGMQPLVQGAGRNRRTWSQVVGSIWVAFCKYTTDSISMPHAEFARELCSAVHDKDHASPLSVQASRPELALYQRVYEGPGYRQYLQRSTQGQRAAQIRFQLRSGTSMLRQHDSRFRDQASHDTVDRLCPVCKEPNSIESIQHVLLHCPAEEHHRVGLRTAVARRPAARTSPSVLLDDEGVCAYYGITSWGCSYCSGYIVARYHHF